MKKIALIFLLIFYMFSTSFCTKANDDSLITSSKSGILIETKTNTILYEKNKDVKLSPASMTKIMTLLLVYEAMDNNLFDKTTKLITSDYAASMGGSQVFLKVGEEITVDEAIKCVCIASANDCAVLLSEKVSGSEKEFVNAMNKRAKDIGCLNTNFTDCTGLNEENHYTTSYDMSLMASYLVSKYPDVLNYTNIKEDYIRKDTSSPFWLVNTNKLVGKVNGLNGLKTGYTSFSGYCITLHMTEGNMSLISVVMGYENALKRNSESLELLRYGFNNYKLDKIISKGDIIESIDHILYKNRISIVVENDIYNVCKRSDKNNYTNKYEYILTDSKLNGSIDIYLDDIKIGSSNLNTNNLDKKGFFDLIFSLIKKAI
jgi:D-alanyl-D-alanine carboxypeptidase (penicillin-binding protein 5/6)